MENFNILTANFWEKEIADYSWGDIFSESDFAACENKIIFCPLEGVFELFEFLNTDDNAKRTGNFVLISGYSDYSLMYQKDFHPNLDINKRVGHIKYQQIAAITDKYVHMDICGAKENRCNPNHKYSIKVDSLTDNTFDEIPDCIVRWYCTNCNVEHPKIELIPFGMNEQGHGKDIIGNYQSQNKTKLLYINFQDYTYNRIQLKQYYGSLQNNETWLTVQPTTNRKYEDFAQDLANHVFVLCPFGNGLDSYRIYETWAVGSIPIVPDCIWSRNLGKLGLPLIMVDNLFGLNFGNLMQASEDIVKGYSDGVDLSVITKDYWKNKFQEIRKQLLKGEMNG